MDKRKTIVSASIIILIVISGFGIMKGLQSMKPEKESEKKLESIKYVKASKVKYSNIISGLEESGRISSQQFLDVISEVQGKLLKGDIPLKEGQTFRKGDLLVKIYDNDVKLAISARKSRFLNIIANLLPDFNIDYPNSYNAWKEFFDNIKLDKDLPELPEIKSGQEKIYLASRNVLSEYYSIKSDELRLQKYFIYAPFEGTFSNVMLELGSVANPGSRIGKIIRTDKLEIEIFVDLENAKYINIGDNTTVKSNDNKNSWNGKVIRKSKFVDPGTQLISITVSINYSIKNPLLQGQYLITEFKGKEIKQVMEVPRNIIFNKNEVFIVKNSSLKIKKINIEKINKNTMLINGLDTTEMLVIEPLINAKEDTPVMIIE